MKVDLKIAKTLVVEDGRPWMVFCHEWCQVGNGRMMAAPLSDDLSRFTAKPIEQGLLAVGGC